MPTGVHLRDVRTQLFDAAERVLLRSGPSALTSRAVTDEAGCAKGVLHKHFTDFDGFLTELVLDRIAHVEARSDSLAAAAGTAPVIDTVCSALTDVFSSVALSIVALITFRDDLRSRLRAARPGPGVPLATDAARMLAHYLTAERTLGHLSPSADVDTLAATLVGTGHLLFADRSGDRDPDTLRPMVASVLSPVLT
ncbi:TetR/AcrR family transcriptional regulator [Amycolatopsis rhabdoformis]|uniref:TetR/AcrR family transcriptional regulator n=1 Tax=Amycolatopsis rhabdoformis TaxID=1448059 RepID=A0ABZ1I4E3_9PSEU|nr:TetR/AcrR family transcriptional regulator [Amycolatopsis rhabdoformis]WSE29294.1 TetR/AcrR family transcriptional regulator [Amycolatopsis rhabdoformis]